jgi:hypothetical protein
MGDPSQIGINCRPPRIAANAPPAASVRGALPWCFQRGRVLAYRTSDIQNASEIAMTIGITIRLV